jgi:hypothetical protein
MEKQVMPTARELARFGPSSQKMPELTPIDPPDTSGENLFKERPTCEKQ